VHRDGSRLDQRALLKTHALRQLVAVILGQGIIPREGTVERRCRSECHIGAQIVLSFLAADTATAGDAGLHCDTVADFQSLDLVAHLVHDAGGFVAEHHRRLDDEVADCAFDPIVHVGAADAGPLGLDNDIVGRGESGNGTVFVDDFSGFLEHERRVLLLIRFDVLVMFNGAVSSSNRAVLSSNLAHFAWW
jgi:hypothetical protein